MQVVPESPAMNAGLLPSDVIIGVNNMKVSSSQELYKYIPSHKEVVLNIKRNLPIEVDWDGRVIRFETVNKSIKVKPTELNVFVGNSTSEISML